MSSVSSRPFNIAEDYMAVRQFLIDTYASFGTLFNWGVERWDIVRYSGNAACELADDRPWERHVRIWEAADRIVGVAHPESGGDLWIEIDPEYREIENEMFAWGEQNRSPARRLGMPFSTWVGSADLHRQKVLRERGWAEKDIEGHTNRRSMSEPLPVRPLADGYKIRSLDLSTERDSEGRAAVSRSAFGHNRTGELMAVLRLAPGYRADFDLAVIADDGTFAAYTTLWWDEANRYVIFEPVGTHADHRRRGLASSVMAEGLRRAADLDVDTAYVGSGAGAPSNQLYHSLGFTDVTDEARWDAPDG